MRQTIFTTKKMKLERKSWWQKTMIGGVITAILVGGAFSAYKLVEHDDSTSRSSSAQHNQSNQTSRSMSIYGKEPVLPAYARQSDPFASLNGKSSDRSSKSSHHARSNASQERSAKKKLNATAKKKDTKSKSKTVVKTKKTKKKTLASNKKLSKKHLADGNHKKKKKMTHKKNKSSHKIAQK
jgi:hypothetical protein